MTPDTNSRVCARTGLRLIADREEQCFRVAKTGYGPTSAPERATSDNPSLWSRYDSPGRTLYVAGDQETAYAEVLSPFKRQLGSTDPLQADAEALGLTRDEFLEEVAGQWRERAFHGLGAVPGEWRLDRDMYRITVSGGGWLIDIEHPDSIAALERLFENQLTRQGVHSLTTAILRGEDRNVTAALAAGLRRIQVDDGSQAIGIHYGSKFGGTWCRALWLPADADDWHLDLIELSGEPILQSDEHLAKAAERFRVKVF
jgi:hypothetical protein